MAETSVAARRFVPVNQTLWPNMLLPGPPAANSAGSVYPFNSANSHYFYFARNAIWHLANMLDLAGGEVLVPSYHHGVEIEALVAAGAEPVFYRVGKHWDVDMADVERLVGPKTKALYLVQYSGFPGPAERMRSLAARHNLPFIEDCALSLFSSDGKRPLGSLGDAAIFCLYKTMPVPNGGVLTLNDPKLASRAHFPGVKNPAPTSVFSHLASSTLLNIELRGGHAGSLVRSWVRRLGKRTVESRGIHRVTTGSDHFNPAHANIGMSPVSKLIISRQNAERIVRTRRRNYTLLLQRLSRVSEPLMGPLTPGVCPLFYPLIVRQKEPVIEALRTRGIETVDLWQGFHPACDPKQFPEAAWLREAILEIPCHQDLRVADIEYIAKSVQQVLRQP